MEKWSPMGVEKLCFEFIGCLSFQDYSQKKMKEEQKNKELTQFTHFRKEDK